MSHTVTHAHVRMYMRVTARLRAHCPVPRVARGYMTRPQRRVQPCDVYERDANKRWRERERANGRTRARGRSRETPHCCCCCGMEVVFERLFENSVRELRWIRWLREESNGMRRRFSWFKGLLCRLGQKAVSGWPKWILKNLENLWRKRF